MYYVAVIIASHVYNFLSQFVKQKTGYVLHPGNNYQGVNRVNLVLMK